MLFAPFLIHLLYKFNIMRGARKEKTADGKILEIQPQKKGTPFMGGLIMVVIVPLFTIVFNWHREWTWIPIGVMLLMAIAGGLDDILDIYGRERPVARVKDVLQKLTAKSSILMKIYRFLLLPWDLYKAIFYELGSSPGRSLHSHERFLLHVLAGVIIAWWYYFKVDLSTKGVLWLPFGLSVDLDGLMVPFIILAVAGTANAVNITDGLDGLAAGTLIPAFGAFGLIAYQLQALPVLFLCATVAGSLTAYLYFNIKPARFFMGDVGSISMGALLAIVSILLNREILLFVIGGIYFFEVLSDILQIISAKLVRRGILKNRIFKLAPFHHHLEQIGWPEEKIVMRAWVVSWLLAGIGVLLAQL
jgi:phospho-N-acetylmuramoyl-pentapeptide-transferase